MNGLMIDDAMVALVSSGELDEGRVPEFIGRTALLQMLVRHGYDGTGGVRDLTAAIDSWRVETGRHGRVSTADLRAGVLDGAHRAESTGLRVRLGSHDGHHGFGRATADGHRNQGSVDRAASVLRAAPVPCQRSARCH